MYDDLVVVGNVNRIVILFQDKIVKEKIKKNEKN